jgi:CRP-like cAMP-binding protein
VSAFKIKNFVDGDVIFKIGDPANNLYFLSDGQVDLLDDKGVVFDQIQKGQPFGEAAFLNGGFRSATVRAKGNVVCKTIKNDAAVKMLHSFSPLLVSVIEALLLQQITNRSIKNLGFKSEVQRGV